jgi:hypothetical protein
MANPVTASSTRQAINGTEQEVEADCSFDEAYFASVLNKAEDWGFLMSSDSHTT